jgi:hypothetical protein
MASPFVQATNSQSGRLNCDFRASLGLIHGRRPQASKRSIFPNPTWNQATLHTLLAFRFGKESVCWIRQLQGILLHRQAGGRCRIYPWPCELI